MAEAVVNIVTELVISAAVDWLKEEISQIVNVKTEVDNIKSKMESIQEVLDDAAYKSMTNHNVKKWLEDLKDISYEMEDVLDEWYTNALRKKTDQDVEDNASQEISNSASSSKFTCLPVKQFKKKSTSAVKTLGWRRGMAKKIKVINEQVNTIFTKMNEHNFISTTVRNLVPTDQDMKSIKVVPTDQDMKRIEDGRRNITSFVDQLQIYGRDAEKDDLLRKLLSESGEEHNKLEVISIIGVGGLGKTTLAQLVHNDKEVKDKFQQIIWVCVSDPFEEIKVAQRILKRIEPDHRNADDLQTLYEYIAKSIEKQQFLLILDDVWDKKSKKWDGLRACRESTCASKSRVLVTTRSKEVYKVNKHGRAWKNFSS